MFKYKRNISILLIILLLTGVTTTVYATDNSGVDEKYVTEEKIIETGEKSNTNTEETANKSVKDGDDSNELRNGDLTKDSKYPFYDELNILSDETKNIILNINKNFEDVGAQVGVVVLNSLNGYSIEEKANEIFNTWGIGNKERNNGALLLISITDRKFRLEVGNGLRETVLSDYKSKEIIDKMIPYFKNEAYNLGINVALYEIDQKFYSYRSYLAEKVEEEQDKKASEAVLSTNNKNNEDIYKEESKSQDSSTRNLFEKPDYSPEKQLDNISNGYAIFWIGIFLLFITLFIALVYVSTQAEREAKQKAREEEERIRQFGKKHSFNIIIEDQHGQTKTLRYTDYSRKKVDKDEVLNDIRSEILNYECFGDDITKYQIESINPSIDNVKYQDLKYVKIKVKTIGQEVVFENDKDRVKATKDFYNRLNKEERDFYMSRANSNMKSNNGTNIWFYLYLYMLLESDRQKSFVSSMRNANIPSDKFYSLKDHNENNNRHNYHNNDSSFDSHDAFSGLNSLNSTFGGDNSISSSFGGFGGGSSSGGGASGGW